MFTYIIVDKILTRQLMRIFSYMSLFVMFTILPSVVNSQTLTNDHDKVEIENNLDNITIYFGLGKSHIDTTDSRNKRSLETMNYMLSDSDIVKLLNTITINAAASPDGNEDYNKSLSWKRAKSIKNYIISNYPSIADKLIVNHIGENWEGLRELVVSDKLVPNSKRVLEIIDSDIRLDTKEWRLRRLDGGSSWRYISKNMLPLLRNTTSTVFHFNIRYTFMPITLGNTVKQSTLSKDVDLSDICFTTKPIYIDDAVVKQQKPILAVKTNLLYNIATLLNLELELPIGDKYSLAADIIHPWWIQDNGKVDSKRNRLQARVISLEFRRWLGDRENKSVLTGWFVGGYGTYGSFDIERNREGMQSKNLLSGGLSLGFAHSISKNDALRLEYSISAGYAQFDYKEYTAEFDGTQWGWDAFRDYTKSFTWIGPTRLELSLVWLISRNTERRSGKW